MKQYCYYDSPIGRICLVSEEQALVRIGFKGEPFPPGAVPGQNVVLQQAMHELQEYFNAVRTDFDVPIRLQGTPFQLQVWSALRNIPYGQTCTYKQLSHSVGRERAYRAVGNANPVNPLPIIVPCHRVVGADGKLTGYRGGLMNKGFLLALETKAGIK